MFSSRFERLLRRLRGSSLIEVMIAGALLAIGMTAIAAMLNESVFSSRMASRKTEASEVGVSTLERLASQGYASLATIPFGTVDGGGFTFDGGRYTDDAGILLYETTYSLTSVGVPAQSRYIEVKVTYWDNLRNPRVQTYGTVVSNPNP